MSAGNEVISRALILVDLQKEFLAKEGRFPIDPRSRTFLDALNILVPAFRRSGGQVVWVGSEYTNNNQTQDGGGPPSPDASLNSDWLSGTHTGRKSCCEPGSVGAEFADETTPLFDEDSDLVITKTWYSAFKETNLNQELVKRGIKTVYLGGLLTNVCVLATALDAQKLGSLKVHVVEDCLGWINGKSHAAALSRMSRENIHISRSGELLRHARATGQGPKKKTVFMKAGDAIGEGDSTLVLDLLPPEMDHTLEKLKAEVKWQTMYHRGGEVPRLVAVEGQINPDGSFPIYRHPADESPVLHPFSPTVQQIRHRVEAVLKHPVNHVLIQHYRSGHDHISEHSDKTIDVVHESKIVNVSIGAQRLMVLRQKKDGAIAQKNAGPDDDIDRDVQRIPLPHNSMFVMGLKTNAKWLHGIRQDKRPATFKTPPELAYGGERISLTFRLIGTFLSADEKFIYGQGATGKTKEQAKPVIIGSRKMTSRMIGAFGDENQQSNFDWQRAYGAGFDVLHFMTPKKLPTLYYVNGSIPSWRVQMALHEKGIEFEQTRLRVMTTPKETRLPPFLSINHRGKTPVLIDTDQEKTTVNESLAILQYLETFYTTKPLLPPIEKRSYRARVLARTQETENLHSIYDALEDAHFGALNSDPQRHLQDEERLELVQAVYAELAYWEVYASQSTFIAGDSFTLADCAFFPFLGYMFRRGFEWSENEPKLKLYFERVRKRECAILAQPEGWVGRGKANVFRMRGI